MSTSTSVHSNAFNFMSFIQGQVDPRTGQYTCAISLPELKANNLCGPVVPLQLNFNPLNSGDSGFGKGWNLQLSQFDPTSRVLSLYTGETFKVNTGGAETVIPEKKLDSFHFHELDSQRYRVEHKSGLVEILQIGQGGLAMPVEMLSPQGHSVTLQYTAFGTDPLLSSIRNADGTPLLSLVRTTNTLQLRLHPGSAFEALFTLNIIDGKTSSLVLPTDDSASWRFAYTPLNDLTCLQHVYSPTGGHETIGYSGAPHSFPGLTNRKLPRVASHQRDPGFGQPVIETRYEYGRDDHNFLGFGSDITWSDDGLDNLYKVRGDYQYETTERLWDATGNQAVRSTRRVFNRFHLMVLEEVSQKAAPGNADTLWVTETEYYINPQLDFKDQPAYCQLPKTVTQTWRNASATEPRHTEVVSTSYDDFGNLLTQVNANGVTETSAWYKAEGEDGCPADPQGFVRNLKSKTVTSAGSDYGNAPTLQTDYRYAEYPGLTGSGPWLALSEETLLNGNQALQHSAFTYIDAPDNAFEHGRKLQDAVTLNGKTTTTGYAYSKTRNARAGEVVLHTVNTLTGFDGEKKVITLEHSLLNGEPLLNRDDNDVEIAYEYDLLGRVTKETVAPGTPYEASRTYTYTLTNAVGQQAMQSAMDVKGVETRTWLDGHNRVLKETRRDADALGGNPQAFRETYRATYNHLEQMISETVIDWERAKDVPLTSLFNYDDWGEQRSVIRPDGIEEHEVTDPIARTTTQWLEGMGKTVTTNNLFDKPDSVKRIDLGGQQISEHLYHYDGLGRTVEEYDAAGNWTRYEYDAFDRMTKTLLPDSNEVERQYAGHSSEDLPVKISVNGVVLGEQVFDGLDRMIVSITGGRESVYTFDSGQSQPKSVKRPSGLETGYVYRPELGEDPEQRIAVESTAQYEYDPQNARLLRTQEQGNTLIREYFSTGELKSERREQTDEDPRVMHYEYSRQARLMSYTDVLEQTQTYEYDQYARLTATALGNTRSTFTYDELGQLQGIETLDGAQRLKIDLEYDDFGREVLRTFDLSGGVIQTLAQTYDEVDRLTQRTLVQGTETLRDEGYAYDSRGRLVEYTCNGSQAPEDPYGKTIQGQLFSFDAQDNLDFVETTFEGGRNASYYEYTNAADPCQLTAITNTHPDYPQRLDFTYDADGNLLQDEAGRLLGYDSLGRLISVSALSGETANDYHYDSLDTLNGRSTSGGHEQRFYQNGELTNQIQGSTRSTFLRADGIVLAEHQAGAGPKSLLLASDDKNSVLCEVSQDARQDIAYSPYGHRADDASLSSHLGYNGERRETQTGWYLLGNGYRAFNPLLMRFHSPDSWSPFGEGGVNTYTYCLGNPIRFTDPTGHGVFGGVMRLFGVATKANKAAKRQAGKAVSEILERGKNSPELIPISKLDPKQIKKINSREVTSEILEHNLIVDAVKKDQALRNEILSNNTWLKKVSEGRVFAKPDRVTEVVEKSSILRQEVLEHQARTRETLFNRPPTFEGLSSFEHPLPGYSDVAHSSRSIRGG
ncbi:RHS repeat-associated core domain-containing protein [Pseudomonas sp. T1.Ur]|uniref:RHS repeat domain-containing protein n=1 Tax=Pseudomonas sp. T1.Ur TaxID=2928704 RepID=UPI00201D6EB3|nr:RHS repeat-associated core domain-containing protein [Pseudomonas sp. T1.Ur]MCL6703288.1 sugar-binding protein [Pseudomonas sp. T1.Ur]